eukprot:3773876-Prymnesium_polylepis.1
MGAHVERLSSRSLVGLVVVVGGFLGYMYFSGPGKGDAEEKLIGKGDAEDPRKQQLQHLAESPAPTNHMHGNGAGPDAVEDTAPYIRLPHDSEGRIDVLAQSLLESTQAVPDDAEPWAFHDRLIGCDSSNSARLVSSQQLK